MPPDARKVCRSPADLIFERNRLEDQEVSYVLAIKRNDTLTMTGGGQRADELIAAVPARAWQRLSAGAGAHGPREFHWARVPVQTRPRPGRGHWLLARRSLSDPADIAYYACYGPGRSRLVDLAWTAGSRWHIEECFQRAKGEAGLDHYQVRSGGPGMPTSPCPCSPWPGSPPAGPRQ